MLENPNALLLLPYKDGSWREVSEADAKEAIDALKSIKVDQVNQTLRRISSPLHNCNYRAIGFPFLAEAVKHHYAADFGVAGKKAPVKAAFLIALERLLEANLENFDSNSEVLKVRQWIQRYVRDSQMIREAKSTYDFRCQLGCDSLSAPSLDHDYVEGAHIKPLHHGGDDRKGNILVLCPNHHVLFDYGAFYVDDSHQAHWSFPADPRPAFDRPLIVRHAIDRRSLRYHRREIAKVVP